MEKHIKAPISKEVSRKLRAGDYVYITGTIYTARDAAHKRMDDALKNGENLPVDMVGQREKGVRLVLQVRQLRAVWTVMRRSFWILASQP